MKKVLIIGSGASGVHFAFSVLNKGYEVIMIDVGHTKTKTVNPVDNFNELKANLSDPVRYFLGEHYEAVIYPDTKSEYYGFPPNKGYVFSPPPNKFHQESQGFAPLFSFARGGLAEAWTAGVYPLNDQELQDFPFRYHDIEPFYNEAARRIGITGEQDDLARFFPWHDNLLEPLRLDQHSQRLLAEYAKHKDTICHRLKCYMGRSRVATLSIDQGEREGCRNCGRCLWGCPSESLYTPLVTLNQCFKSKNFKYVPNMYASHFTYNSKKNIKSIIAESVIDKKLHEFYADSFVLAAGTLSSSIIFMESIRRETGEIIKLPGLMDNRQILIPFINLKMIGEIYDPNSYQYHQISVGMETKDPKEYIHGQITTLKSALVHPIIHNLPFDLKTSTFIFRNIRSGLGVINLNFHDTRRAENYITLKAEKKNDISKLIINYSPKCEEKSNIRHTINIVKKLLWKLKCVVPPGMIHIRPMGASVHYAGTIPMSTIPCPLTTSQDCQSHDFNNLYFVDGTTFPFLPAKNLTFTLMANAIRVAETAF